MRLAAVVLFLTCAVAHATTTVGVRPFQGAPDRLALLAQPVADAVARALAARGVAATAGKDATGALLVELRFRTVGAKVALEAVVTLPDGAGGELGRVSTRPNAPGKLDVLATELGRALVPVVELAAEKIPRPAPPPLAPPVTPPTVAPPLPPPAPPTMPKLAFAMPQGQLGHDGDMLDVGPAALRAIFGWAERNDVEVTSLIERGVLMPVAAAQGAAGAGARATLLIALSDIALVQRGVLTGSGTVELYLVGVDGKLRLRETIHSSTIVVGRDDGAEELVTRLVAQALDAKSRLLRARLVGP